MNLNRITVNILNKTSPGDKYCKEFGSLLRYQEDIIFHHLTKRTNFGGFGFFHTMLYEDYHVENEVIQQGQILKVNLKNLPINFAYLLSLNDESRLNLLLEFSSKSVKTAEKDLGIKSEDLHEAINKAKETGLLLKDQYDKYWMEYYKIDNK